MSELSTYQSQTFSNLKIEQNNQVLLVQLNRPKELNALSNQLLGEIASVLASADPDPSISVIVVTGNARAFAAGADIDELAQKTGDMVSSDPRNAHWATIRNINKPVIGAVNGFCLGGGNELAMTCDFLIAGKNAQFGQPEINLAILPGAGGTQRLTQLAGKGKAMRWILTGEMINAQEALAIGLVTELCEPELTVDRAIEVAHLIARKAPLATLSAKKAVKAATETLLNEGLAIERSEFAHLLSTEDKLEGIRAFKEKRTPKYTGK